jgi:hypothetical protein
MAREFHIVVPYRVNRMSGQIWVIIVKKKIAVGTFPTAFLF